MLSFFCAFCQILFGDCSRILHQMPKISGILYIQRGKRWGKPMPWKYLRITRRCTRDTLLPGQRGLRNTAAQYIEPPYVIFFRLFRVNIPNLDVFSKIGHCIAHKETARNSASITAMTVTAAGSISGSRTSAIRLINSTVVQTLPAIRAPGSIFPFRRNTTPITN